MYKCRISIKHDTCPTLEHTSYKKCMCFLCSLVKIKRKPDSFTMIQSTNFLPSLQNFNSNNKINISMTKKQSVLEPLIRVIKNINL